MSNPAPKTVKESAIHDQSYPIFPHDLNMRGTIFGGCVMAQVDKVAAVVAMRHSGLDCVTKLVDEQEFIDPAYLHENLILMASVNRVWNTSMEIGVKVLAENPKTRAKRHIVSAYLTFVAVDENQRPTSIPPVIPETDEERRRFAEAQWRRDERKRKAEEKKKMRENQKPRA